MRLGGVHRQQREPRVVRLEYRTAERVLVNVTGLEILEETAPPTLFDSHLLTLFRRVAPLFSRRAASPRTRRKTWTSRNSRWSTGHRRCTRRSRESSRTPTA